MTLSLSDHLKKPIRFNSVSSQDIIYIIIYNISNQTLVFLLFIYLFLELAQVKKFKSAFHETSLFEPALSIRNPPIYFTPLGFLLLLLRNIKLRRIGSLEKANKIYF